MNIKVVLLGMTAILLILFVSEVTLNKRKDLPVIAIANYGPHSSLEASIVGTKAELARHGFIENKNIRYEIADVGFDASLIPQMISTLKNHSPKVMVVLATPVAQFAKGAIKNIPLIYSDITDPVGAGLLNVENSADLNMSGSSDRQDLKVLLKFSKKLMPEAKKVGLLFSTAEVNDIVLVQMMKKAAKKFNMEVLPIAVDQARDVPLRMQLFKDKVDFIYVGGSGPIQPTLPVIAAEANKMKIPVLNVNEDAVKDGLVLASFGVSYHQVGVNAGKLVAQLLNGNDLAALRPIYPTLDDHHGFISQKKAQALGLKIPADLTNTVIVE